MYLSGRGYYAQKIVVLPGKNPVVQDLSLEGTEEPFLGPPRSVSQNFLVLALLQASQREKTLGKACGRTFHKNPERNKGSDCSNGRKGNAEYLFACHAQNSLCQGYRRKLNLKSVFYLYSYTQLVKQKNRAFFGAGTQGLNVRKSGRLKLCISGKPACPFFSLGQTASLAGAGTVFGNTYKTAARCLHEVHLCARSSFSEELKCQKTLVRDEGKYASPSSLQQGITPPAATMRKAESQASENFMNLDEQGVSRTGRNSAGVQLPSGSLRQEATKRQTRRQQQR